MPDPDDLFGAPDPAAPPQPDANRPLADRLRPAKLSEVVGQDHLLGPQGTLTRMLERDFVLIPLGELGVPNSALGLNPDSCPLTSAP